MQFDKKLFIALFFAFIISTIAGTVFHELGHYAVAKYLGFHPRINYAYTYMSPEDNINPPCGNCFFYVLLGGPLQTMLTGTIGLVLLSVYRKSFLNIVRMSVLQWVIVFISLFWLRQPSNLVMYLAGGMRRGHFSLRGDEQRLALYLHAPSGIILWGTGLIGTTVLALIIFRIVPAQQRVTFMIAGLAGGIAGYLFWLQYFGRYILP